jgi:hypothetical protein
MKPLRKIYIIFLGVLLFLGACENPLPDSGEEPEGFTHQDESDLGDEFHKAIASSTLFNVLSDAENSTYYAAYQYLSGLRGQIWGTGLLERRRDFDWKIYILEDDNNQRCFTTVGGKLYVTTGLLRDMVANEAELLGVLAHEMYYADLSYHKDRLLEYFSFTEILDVKYGGENAKALEMIGTFYNMPRNANLVPQADQFAADIICTIGGVSINAFGNVIENTSITNPTPDWYINHPTPSTSSVEDRKSELQVKAINCSTDNDNQVHYNRYLDFLNVLPPR